MTSWISEDGHMISWVGGLTCGVGDMTSWIGGDERNEVLDWWR